MNMHELNEYLQNTVPFRYQNDLFHQHNNNSLSFYNINHAYNTGTNFISDVIRREHPENEGLIIHMHSSYMPTSTHAHDFFEMMYVRSGSITHYVGDQTVVLNSGDFFLLAPGVFHSIERCEEKDIALNFVINVGYLTPHFMNLISHNQLFYGFINPYLNGKSDEKNPYIVVTAKDNSDVLETADKMLCEFFDPDICSGNILKGSFPNLLNLLFRSWKGNGGFIKTRKNINDEDIRQIFKYVETNYATATLKEAALRFGYNPDYLSRLIKTKLGFSFGEMKHQVCIEQAKALLSRTGMPISEIAQKIGFSNMSFFYSLFYKYCQTTPAEYRKNTNSK